MAVAQAADVDCGGSRGSRTDSILAGGNEAKAIPDREHVKRSAGVSGSRRVFARLVQPLRALGRRAEESVGWIAKSKQKQQEDADAREKARQSEESAGGR